jgi:hypothetical protein
MARFNLTVLMLLLVIGIPYYWFLLDNTAPEAQPQPISISQLRSLATVRGKAAPARIRFERITSQTLMGNRVAAGMGLRGIRLHTLSYMIDYGDAPPVLIGAGMTPKDAARFEHRTYSAKAQARVTRALLQSHALIPLSLAPEQLGGLRMIDGTRQAKALDAKLAGQQETDRKGVPYRVAPGVVVIPTPHIGSGARMVYARLADGREYLFAGDISPIKANWYRLRLPARFVTDLGRREDRRAMRSWLLTIRHLTKQAPGLIVVPGRVISRRSGLQHFFDDSAHILL